MTLGKLGRMAAICLGCAILLAFPRETQAGPGDAVVTERRVISEVLLTPGSGGSYYVSAIGGWGAANCPGAIYAYLLHETPGAEGALSAILTARASGKPIGFSGICGDASGQPQYIQIRNVYF